MDHRRSQAEYDPGADRLPYGKRHFLAVHLLHHFPQEKVLQNKYGCSPFGKHGQH